MCGGFDILLFSVDRGLNNDRNIIHANLLTSMAIAQIIFLAGIEQTKNEVCSENNRQVEGYVAVGAELQRITLETESFRNTFRNSLSCDDVHMI